MFTAEHFDAEEWIDLFDKAGARSVGPVAEHHADTNSPTPAVLASANGEIHEEAPQTFS